MPRETIESYYKKIPKALEVIKSEGLIDELIEIDNENDVGGTRKVEMAEANQILFSEQWWAGE